MKIIQELRPDEAGIDLIRAHRLPYIAADARVWVVAGRLLATDAVVLPGASVPRKLKHLGSNGPELAAWADKAVDWVGFKGRIGEGARVRRFPAILPLIRKRAGDAS